jgi:hypothetical protein
MFHVELRHRGINRVCTKTRAHRVSCPSTTYSLLLVFKLHTLLGMPPKSALKGTAADWDGLDPAFMTVSLLAMYLALVSHLSGVDVIYVVHHGQDFAQPSHWTH